MAVEPVAAVEEERKEHWRWRRVADSWAVGWAASRRCDAVPPGASPRRTHSSSIDHLYQRRRAPYTGMSKILAIELVKHSLVLKSVT